MQQIESTKNWPYSRPMIIDLICYLTWQEGMFWNQTFEEDGDGDIQEIRHLLDEDKSTQDKDKEAAC